MKKRGYQAPDDQPLVVLKRDVSGGINTRQEAQEIDDKQSVLLQNILLENAGSRTLRKGQFRFDTVYPQYSDPNTKLLLHLDNNVTDSEYSPKTVTNNSVTFSNSIFKFGYSALFSGANGVCLSLSPSSDFNFGLSNFTVDMWVNPSSIINNPVLFMYYTSSTDYEQLFLTLDGEVKFQEYEGSAVNINIKTSGANITTGVWKHIALVRNGTNIQIYVNGVSYASITSSWNIEAFTTNFIIGSQYGISNSSNLSGYIDEFRVSNSARWTSNFTTPTSAYTNIINPSSSGYGLFGFNPDGGTFELMAMQDGILSGWPSSGSFIQRQTGFTDGVPTTMIKAGQQAQLDVLIISNGIDDAFVMYQNHTFYDLGTNQYYSMPKTKAICYYQDRVWTLKNNLAAFSDAFPPTYYPTAAVITGDQSTYSGTSGDKIAITIDGTLYDNINIGGDNTIAAVVATINGAISGTPASVSGAGYLVLTSPTVGTSSNVTIADGSSTSQTVIAKLFSGTLRTITGYAPFDLVTNVFRMPTGTAQALLATRDQGIIFMGADQIWQLSPSATPNPTTDQPLKVLDIGCVAGATAVQVADDIIFLAPDGVRGLFRTQLDKLQTGQSFPLSYVLADQFNSLNWNAISGACAIFFDNKYLISVPVNGSSYNNQVWVYYPALSTAFYASTNTSNLATMRSWVLYEGWNIARFAIMNINGEQTLFGIDSVTGEVYELFSGTSDNGNPIVYDEISKAEDFKVPLQYKYGGEFKIRVLGGNGVLVVSANADNLGWTQLGTIGLTTTGVMFPTAFPVVFTNVMEVYGVWHLDDAGIIRFKRCEFEIYCNTPNAVITIIESIVTAFQEPYVSEDTYPPYLGPVGNALLTETDDFIEQETGQKMLTE